MLMLGEMANVLMVDLGLKKIVICRNQVRTKSHMNRNPISFSKIVSQKHDRRCILYLKICGKFYNFKMMWINLLNSSKKIMIGVSEKNRMIYFIICTGMKHSTLCCTECTYLLYCLT